MAVNQQLWIVLLGVCVFVMDGFRSQKLPNDSNLFDIEKDLIESYKAYEDLISFEVPTTLSPAPPLPTQRNRIVSIPTAALYPLKSLPIVDGQKYQYGPYPCQQEYEVYMLEGTPCKYSSDTFKSIHRTIYTYPTSTPVPIYKPIPLKPFPTLASLPVYKPLSLPTLAPLKAPVYPPLNQLPTFKPFTWAFLPVYSPTFAPWKAPIYPQFKSVPIIPTFKPFTLAPLPVYKSLLLPTFKPYTRAQTPVLQTSKHYIGENPKSILLKSNLSTIQLHTSSVNMDIPHLTMSITGKRNYNSFSPSIYISNKDKTIYLSPVHNGTLQFHDVGNTKTTNDFNLLLINDCKYNHVRGDCSNVKTTRERFVAQPQSASSNDSSRSYSDFLALLQLVKDYNVKHPNVANLSDRQAILKRPYDIVDEVELVAKPFMAKDKNSLLEQAFKEIAIEGPKERFLRSPWISTSGENTSRHTRTKEYLDEIQFRQTPGDVNTALSGLSQPASINSSDGVGFAVAQPNSPAGDKPRENLSSGGTDNELTIPGSVGVSASKESAASRNI